MPLAGLREGVGASSTDANVKASALNHDSAERVAVRQDSLALDPLLEWSRGSSPTEAQRTLLP